MDGYIRRPGAVMATSMTGTATSMVIEETM
jgi:hypothetical protein